jgi:hypothetical protein
MKHPGGRPPIHGTATVTYTLRLTPAVRDEFLRLVEAYKAKAAAQNMSANATHVFIDMLRRYQESDVVGLAQAIAKERGSDLVPVFELVRRMGGSVDTAKARILAAANEGRLELRPESGMGLLSKEDAALCLPGPRGSVLSTARVLR